MPSVFITARNTGDAIPFFKKKGIPDSMPGVVGEIPIIIESPFYAFPARAYKYVFHAIITKVAVITTPSLFINIFKRIGTLSHLYDVPIATFRFEKLDDKEVAELKGMGLQQDLVNSNLFVGSPPTHLLGRINAIGPIGDRPRPGHLTFDAFFAWVFLMKGIQIYTTTKNQLDPNPFNFTTQGTIIETASKGRLRTICGSLMDYTNDSMKSIYTAATDYVFGPPITDVSLFTGSVIDAASGHQFGEGVFFPFFLGMTVMDKMTCYEVFKTIFTGCLSEKPENDTEIMAKIRAGVRQLAFSRTGLVMAHIYKCISLVEQIGGGKIHVIVKGSVYIGVVIEGSFSVNLFGRITKSGSVMEDIRKSSLLEGQADDVVALMNSAMDGNGNSVYAFTQSDFMSSRRALTCWNSVDRDLYSGGQIEKARGLLKEMDFNDSYPLPTQKTIGDAINFMATGDSTILKDYPAYLDGGVLTYNTRVWEALSVFGPKAPSVNTGDSKGTIISFPRVGANDANLTRVDGIRPLHYFPFWQVPIAQAANQWNTLFERGSMSIPKGRKGKKEFTDLHRVHTQIASDPLFTTVYDHIKSVVNDHRRTKEETGKRKRGSDDGDKKGKKARTGGINLDGDL